MNDGSLIITGAHGVDQRTSFVLKLNSDLTLAWCKQISSTGSYTIQDAAITNNEDIILSGYNLNGVY